MRRTALLVLAAVELAGCAAEDDPLIFSLHTFHEFTQGPRNHGFPVDDGVARLVAHLEFSASPEVLCEDTMRIVIRFGAENITTVVPSSSPGCAAFHEAELEPRAGTWTISFEGEGPALGAVDVRGERATSGGLRLAR